MEIKGIMIRLPKAEKDILDKYCASVSRGQTEILREFIRTLEIEDKQPCADIEGGLLDVEDKQTWTQAENALLEELMEIYPSREIAGRYNTRAIDEGFPPRSGANVMARCWQDYGLKPIKSGAIADV